MRKLSKNEWVAVIAAIAVIAILFFGGSIWDAVAGMFGKAPETASQPTNTIQPMGNPENMKNISTVKGLEIYDEIVGTSTVEAVPGKEVTVTYIGVFQNGQKFDASADHGGSFSFVLGAGNVIKGWDLGVAGMKVGGVRRLVISSDLGYGPNDYGPIPGGSTLIFQVQLLGVK